MIQGDLSPNTCCVAGRRPARHRGVPNRDSAMESRVGSCMGPNPARRLIGAPQPRGGVSMAAGRALAVPSSCGERLGARNDGGAQVPNEAPRDTRGGERTACGLIGTLRTADLGFVADFVSTPLHPSPFTLHPSPFTLHLRSEKEPRSPSHPARSPSPEKFLVLR
jgi:hypothetical protein